MEKTRLAKYIYEEGDRIRWNDAKVVQIEPTTCAESIKKWLIWRVS
jgi:hypothetical protein